MSPADVCPTEGLDFPYANCDLMIVHEFNEILDLLQSQQDLKPSQMESVIAWFLSGEADPQAMRKFLELLADKGESVDELTGAARAMRTAMHAIDTELPIVVDTCGTGGDGSKTFNISTAAAIVTAAAAVPVAKHGNRKITSSTGSADVLAELGVNLEAPPATAAQCLHELGLCFCFAPFFHPAMRHVGPVRREIPRPTIFNRLGPLANPARANCQVLGVGDLALQDVLAKTLHQLGTLRSIVVRGEDGVDELSISAPSRVLFVSEKGIDELRWQPDDFGLPAADRQTLFADDPASSADCIREVIDGQAGPKRDVVVLNAAAAIWLAMPEQELDACVAQAQSAIDSGAAKQLLTKLGEATQGT